jgi:hypothetical protein
MRPAEGTVPELSPLVNIVMSVQVFALVGAVFVYHLLLEKYVHKTSQSAARRGDRPR